MKAPIRSAIVVAGIVLLAGCAASPAKAPPAPAAAPTATAAPIPNLRKGMEEAEVRRLWGEPKTVTTGTEGKTILVYQFPVRTQQRMVATSMVEVPNYDPINGLYKPVSEPVYSPQAITVIRTFFLVVRNGVLESWAQRDSDQRDFN